LSELAMVPSAYNAWKENETLRQWFEVIFDTFVNPPEHSGYVCKGCWEQFEARTNAMRLIAHSGWHESQGELPYSTARPFAITGEQVFDLYSGIREYFDAVTPAAGTWKFQCRSCKKLLPHRTTHRDLMEHARTCIVGDSPGGKMQLTDPSYISHQMFDKAVREKFQDNPDDGAVRQQAFKLLQMVRSSQWRSCMQRKCPGRHQWIRQPKSVFAWVCSSDSSLLLPIRLCPSEDQVDESVETLAVEESRVIDNDG
jgi:hypothetical protein